MTVEKQSPCKVNLLLNILSRRPDGFHELETLMHPVPLFDTLRLDHKASGVELTSNQPSLPTDARNLVHRAATAFLAAAGCADGVRIHLEKRIPLAAGLGGGSANAATTLLALNQLFGDPLTRGQLHELATTLGSDVPFFLQDHPAVATGRGERIEPLEFFRALQGQWLLLIHPGFGIATAWAYHQLVRFPEALHGRPGRAWKLVELLRTGPLESAAREFYNALEAPALEKYPVLALYQEFLREHGAVVALMSGSGSTTFAIIDHEAAGREIQERFQAHFGSCWTALVRF